MWGGSGNTLGGGGGGGGGGGEKDNVNLQRILKLSANSVSAPLGLGEGVDLQNALKQSMKEQGGAKSKKIKEGIQLDSSDDENEEKPAQKTRKMQEVIELDDDSSDEDDIGGCSNGTNEGEWACDNCTLLNSTDAIRCGACDIKSNRILGKTNS